MHARLCVLAAAALAACRPPAPAASAPAAGGPDAAAVPIGRMETAGSGSDIYVCVVENGELRNIPVLYDRRTGDTLTLDRRLFRTVYPTGPQYAVNAPWFIAHEPIEHAGRTFRKYGLPRILGVRELVRAGEYRGVPLFTGVGPDAPAGIVYVPARTGCEFQPYIDSALLRATAPPPGAAPPPVLLHRGGHPIPICVLEDDGLRYVEVLYNTRTGDTVTNPERRPFREAHRTGPQYAGGARWYIEGEVLPWQGRALARHGPPRELAPREVVRVGRYRGVPVYAAADGGGTVLWVPVRPGCVFQAYHDTAFPG
ncbi:MAG TPA: hypothetical protein VFQ45_22880 [Longimicrobium sp.]|nr:hypothetical protein [Longimicrobium sp.]